MQCGPTHTWRVLGFRLSHAPPNPSWRLHLCMCVYVCACVCMWACVYACMSTCMRTCSTSYEHWHFLQQPQGPSLAPRTQRTHAAYYSPLHALATFVFALCSVFPHSMHHIFVGLARTVYIHRIWPYIWCIPCRKYRMCTIYTGSGQPYTLHICRVGQNRISLFQLPYIPYVYRYLLYRTALLVLRGLLFARCQNN